MDFNGKTWTAAKMAADLCKSQGIGCRLVGTLGLAAHDHYHFDEDPFTILDADFLVGRIPTHPEVVLILPNKDYPKKEEFEGEVASWWPVPGVKVNFISHDDEGGRRFFSAPTVIHEVPCAALLDILGLKKWANRSKDRSFFEVRPELAALVADVVPRQEK